MRRLQRTAGVGVGLALGDQLLRGLEITDDLIGCVANSLQGGAPGRVWADEGSPSPLAEICRASQVENLA